MTKYTEIYTNPFGIVVTATLLILKYPIWKNI